MSLSSFNNPLSQKSIFGIDQPRSEISWKLTVDLDTQQQLFYQKLLTNYVVDTFICSCGHTEFAIKDKKQEIAYRCTECENEHFYNANLAWQNYYRFVSEHDLNFSFEYKVFKKEDGIGIGYALSLPKSINLMRNTITFEYKNIYTIFINESGEMTKSYETKVDTDIYKTMEQKLVQNIEKLHYFDIEYAKSKKLTLSKIIFFLKHPYLNSSDYYYWKEVDTVLPDENIVYDIAQGIAKISNYRTERSVKKAAYTEYLRQMDSVSSFHPGCIYVFSRTITDPNILVKLLSLPSLRYLNDYWVEIETFILFLKQYYNEKQISKLFEINTEEDRTFYLLRDTLNMLTYDYAEIDEYFSKVKCTIVAIHDEFLNCQSIAQAEEYLFGYTKKELEKCIFFNGYKVLLPKSNIELFDWGDSLHNCLLNYASAVKNRLSLIYGFCSEDELIFAVEVQNNRIVQASCKYNAELDAEEKFVLYEWFDRFFK